MRIELIMTVLAGAAGGLVGTLWAGLVSAPLFAHWPALRPQPWQPETAARLLTGAALYGLCGAAAGLLFWLSWGLIAVVSTPWQVVGTVYGALLFTASGLPTLGALALKGRPHHGVVAVLAAEGLVAAISAGVLCAYVWHRVA
ncbi:MAG: hypothetical protein K0R70_464 [Steroidobacteraceae bacterium]|nr:hypothetical protein [Steroidobacteraceae bacterium]